VDNRDGLWTTLAEWCQDAAAAGELLVLDPEDEAGLASLFGASAFGESLFVSGFEAPSPGPPSFAPSTAPERLSVR
jgi:hypothetical protein